MTSARAVTLALGLVGAMSFVVLARAYWPHTVDDTFIFLRYARNLAEGAGLTWNPGEAPAEGYTAFSWTVVLALPFLLGLPPVTFAKLLGCLCVLGAALFAAQLASRLVRRESAEGWHPMLAGGIAAVLVLAVPASAIHATAGMETGLAMLLFTWWLVEAERISRGESREVWLAVSGLLLGLTRPEGNLVVVVTGLWLAWQLPPAQRRRLATRAALGFALPGAIYFVWRYARYGHLLPLPFYVKAVAPGLGWFAGWPQCVELLRLFTVEQPWLGVPLVVAAVRFPFARVVMLGAALWWGFFLFPAHEMGFDLRYLQPLFPALFALVAAGVVQLARMLGPRASPVPVALVVCACLMATFWSHLRGSIAEKVDYGRGGERSHTPIGQWLASVRDRVDRPVVATLDAGAIAYYARGWSVIDTWGLNDTEIALAAASKGRSGEAILARKPSVVIVISKYADRFEPQFEFEGPLYAQALEQGFSHVHTWEFAPDYFLWALALPTVPPPTHPKRRGEAP